MDLADELSATAERILAAIGQGTTAWELKMRLKVSHTRLHVALGMLVERGKITVRPENLTYSVAPASKPSIEVAPVLQSPGAAAERPSQAAAALSGSALDPGAAP